MTHESDSASPYNSLLLSLEDTTRKTSVRIVNMYDTKKTQRFMYKKVNGLHSFATSNSSSTPTHEHVNETINSAQQV